MSDKTNTALEKPKLPQVAFPLKAKIPALNILQQYFIRLANDPSARFLFNQSGLWHQGIHFRASKFLSSEYDNQQICAIADGKLIAYKVDSEYKVDEKIKASNKQGAVYSTGFFLLEHEIEYPKGNKLTFYSLYRHTAKLSDYAYVYSDVIALTKSADKNSVSIRDEKNQSTGNTLPNGRVIKVRKSQDESVKYDELLWYKDEQGNEQSPKNGKKWKIFRNSYETAMQEDEKGIPLLAEHHIKTVSDKEILLTNPIDIKAGTILGLMGEYNQKDEINQKLLHLEVFTYDDIETFRTKAKAAYNKDTEKKGIQDNFLYVARGSKYYSLSNNQAKELGQLSTEIMLPLSEVDKKTITTKNTSQDYYNIQPYLHNSNVKSEVGIYVDNSHLTQGILFPGVNIFTQESDSLSLFKNKLHQYLNPKSELSIEEKNELDPMFKAIMKELDLERKVGNKKVVKFEAGRLKDLLFDPIEQRRLTGIIAKHDSEWKATRVDDFREVIELYNQSGLSELAAQIKKRVEDLSIKLELLNRGQAYYMHPLGVMGLLNIPMITEFDWFETPIVKLILSKESKGSYNAYNLTKWINGVMLPKYNRVYKSYFAPTEQYYLEKMTITEIQKEQRTYLGPEKIHLFAVGIVQMTPSTLNVFLDWLSKYKKINKETQLFDRSFQNLSPLFFWEDKRPSVSRYFKEEIDVEDAAYSIAQEWASAAVPKGYPLQSIKGKPKRISDGTMSYYEGDSLNKAHYSAEQTIKALRETKRMIDDNGGYITIRKNSLEKLGD